jgi:hypothetical protein
MSSGCASISTKATRRATVAAIGPRVVGAALNHDVAGFQLHRRVVHVHLDIAVEHDCVVDRLGAMHGGRVAGREVDHREARDEICLALSIWTSPQRPQNQE